MVNPVERIFPSTDILQALRQHVRATDQVYLVGGAVRDMLMQNAGRDFDFVVSGDALQLARRTADAIGAAFYVMDAERQTARLIYHTGDGQRWFLDFSSLRGATIQEDLEGRDFTINAIAISLEDINRVIDPLHGAQAIRDRSLEMCSPQSFVDDPLRVLRAVRLSADFGFHMTPATISALKAAIPHLQRVSMERKRDELFRILESRQAAAGLRTGFTLGVFDSLLPEVVALKGEQQAAPHIYDVFDHTLAFLDAFVKLYDLLVEPFVEGKGSNLIYGMALMEIGRFRDELARHFSQRLNPNRSLFGLAMLAGLLHDSAKPITRTIDEAGRMHFYDHDNLGAQSAERRGQELALSTDEVERLILLVRHHMRIHHLVKSSDELSRRNIYRYYRDLGEAGVEMVLFSLADKLATYGVTITPAVWEKELHFGRQLLDAWFAHKESYIRPARLVSGSDLIEAFQVKPGPRLGELLEAIREAQAIGEVSTREEALHFAEEWLKTNSCG